MKSKINYPQKAFKDCISGYGVAEKVSKNPEVAKTSYNLKLIVSPNATMK